MEILLTGASGFVGSLLLGPLLRGGDQVRALVREPARLQGSGAGNLRVIRGDLLTGEGLDQALRGVEVAYYLVHSMETSPGAGGFVERERAAATNFAAAAVANGVRRIVYLGGLVPPSDAGARSLGASRHLASRLEVEQILMDAVSDSLALRASIVIGARSRSFRLLVHLVERMPLLALPPWRRFRTAPIDERDVTAMLLACARSEVSGEVLEIGGPDVLSYQQMLEAIAELMLVGRPSVRLPVDLAGLTARLAAAIASEDPELVVPLMEGLQGDLLPRDDHAAQRLGVRLHTFESAVEHALAEWERAEPLAAR